MTSALSLRWNGEIKLTDLFVILGFTLTSATAYLAFRQFRMSAATNRARFLLDIMRWYYDNERLRSLFYRLDYDDWRFDANPFPLSADEPTIDHMLFLYDIMGHFVLLDILKADELPVITFEAARVLKNPEILKYLAWLDNEYRAVGVKGPAFGRARFLADRISH